MMKMLDLDNVCLFARLGSEIYGGCVFTPHYDVNGKGQGEFIELHYLGVDQNCQNSGIGSRLLLELKVWAQKMKIPFIITYADNNKFEDFFRKQGFGDAEVVPFLEESYI